jgi:hypothetical protein
MNNCRIPVGFAIALLTAAGCDMSSSALGRTEPTVKAAIERSDTIEDAAAPAAQSATPAQPETAGSTPGATRVVGIPEGAPKVDARGITEATFDDVKFEMVKTDKFERSMLTPKVKTLFDKRIRIRGYMYPTMRRKGLTQFVLVRDNMECCFGPGAALYDCILISMAPGKTAEYSIRPIAVEGTFRLDEYPGPDGRPLAIYRMQGEAVQ